MHQKLRADLTSYTFVQFLDFLFTPSGQSESTNGRSNWYFSTEVCFEPRRIHGYYVRLFRNSVFLLDRYSPAQLEEGFSAMMVRSLSCSVREIIWSPELPFVDRAECVRSMVDLYRDLFQRDTIGLTASVWWDSLCFDWECGNRQRSRGGEDLVMQDVLFGALSDVAAINSPVCRDSALHGLEHLHHPETLRLVRGLIQSHPELAEELTEYADYIRSRDSH